MRTAVVGHVEWVTFARVDHVPAPGEIVHADDTFELPAGGGPVAAVQLRKLAGNCTFYTALGDDELGHRATMRAARRWTSASRRRSVRTRSAARSRTSTRPANGRSPSWAPASAPMRTIRCPGTALDDVDAVYFCAGDDDALREARRAKVLVVTSREHERIARAGVYIDAVVGSAKDASERFTGADPAPGLVVETLGATAGATARTTDVRARSAPDGCVVRSCARTARATASWRD